MKGEKMTIREHIEHIRTLEMNEVDNYISELKMECEENDENFEDELRKRCIDTAPGSLYSCLMDLPDGQSHEDDDGDDDEKEKEKDALSKVYFDKVEMIDDYIRDKYNIEV